MIIRHFPTLNLKCVSGLEHLPFGTIFDTILGQLRSLRNNYHTDGCFDWLIIRVHR